MQNGSQIGLDRNRGAWSSSACEMLWDRAAPPSLEQRSLEAFMEYASRCVKHCQALEAAAVPAGCPCPAAVPPIHAAYNQHFGP